MQNDMEKRLRSALRWCSGSDDFQVGGKAREGWEKVCVPLLQESPDTDDKLTASEAVYGFVGWLTTQPGIIKMGAGENCSPVIDAVAAFCKQNRLADPREGWNNNLIHTNGECSGPAT